MTAQIGVCGFYAVNGKHCVISGKCIVCHEEQPPELAKGQTITLKNFGPLDGDYKITNIKNGTLSLEFVKCQP